MRKDEQPPADWLKKIDKGAKVKIILALRKNKRSAFLGHVVKITGRIIEVYPEVDFEVDVLPFGRKTGRGTGRFENTLWLHPA